MKTLFACVALLLKPVYRRLQRQPSLEATKRLCLELIDDVHPDRRVVLSRSILKASRLEDMWDLRSAVFGSVSLSFGEREARQRVAKLDSLLS